MALNLVALFWNRLINFESQVYPVFPTGNILEFEDQKIDLKNWK